MPIPSAFTSGSLVASSQPTHAERIYRSLINSMGGQYSKEIGSRSEAWCYATAMAMGRVRNTFDRVRNQMDPRLAVELLPVWEDKLGIVPGSVDTITDRQDAVALKHDRGRVGTYNAITVALDAVLGSEFVAYLPSVPQSNSTSPSTANIFPSFASIAGGNGPYNFLAPTTTVKLVRLTQASVITGSPTVVSYVPVEGVVDRVSAGDRIVMSANNIGLAESVTIASATSSTFTVTLTKAHEAGDICTTGPFPFWISTQLHSLIVVTQSAAEDPKMRSMVDGVMRQMARATATWDIVPVGTGNSVAVFTTDDPVLGRPGYAPLAPAATF